MKQIIFLVLIISSIALQGCIENPETAKARTPKYETVQIVYYGDLTKSFYNKYTTPFPYLFKPLCTKISKSYTLDFRYGLITDNSILPLTRYYAPHVEEDKNTSNPWMQEQQQTKKDDGTRWRLFSEAITTQLLKKPTAKSDCASAINRAITSFQEYDSNARKILLLCTDLEDSYANIPHVPDDVEVLTVGLMPHVRVDSILHTKNVRRFESLEAALDFLSTSIN